MITSRIFIYLSPVLLAFVRADFQPICNSSRCHNNSTCLESPFSSEGFSCRCSDGYHGKTCAIKLPVVECLGDKIVLTVEKALVVYEVNVVDRRHVYLGEDQFRDTNCLSRDVDGKLIVTLYPPFSSCGTVSYTEGGNLFYRNRLYLDTTHDSSLSNRQRIILLDWTCFYARRYAVSWLPILPGKNVPEEKISFGKFTMDLKVFRSADFNEASLLRPPAVFAIGQRLYAEVELVTSVYQGFVVTLDSCRASNTADPYTDSSVYVHHLIRDGCPHWLDASVVLHESGISKQAQFSFQMFKWSSSPTPVYLHCVVTICNSTRYKEECQPDCSGNITSSGARWRRSVETLRASSDLRLTVGPFLIDLNTTNSYDVLGRLNSSFESNMVSPKQDRKPGVVETKYIVVCATIAAGLSCLLIFISIYIYHHRNSCFLNKVLKSKPETSSLCSTSITTHPVRTVVTVYDIRAEGRIESEVKEWRFQELPQQQTFFNSVKSSLKSNAV